MSGLIHVYNTLRRYINNNINTFYLWVINQQLCFLHALLSPQPFFFFYHEHILFLAVGVKNHCFFSFTFYHHLSAFNGFHLQHWTLPLPKSSSLFSSRLFLICSSSGSSRALTSLAPVAGRVCASLCLCLSLWALMGPVVADSYLHFLDYRLLNPGEQGPFFNSFFQLPGCL